MNQEEMISLDGGRVQIKKPLEAGDRSVGGVFRDEDLNFTFVIWSHRALENEESQNYYDRWKRQGKERGALRNKQIDLILSL